MDKEKKMKKKLFIGGAYLVVALLLLIYVSYSAYRIKIAARVQMPEALEQKASLNIEYYSQEKGEDNDPNGLILNDLRPNEKAETYKGLGYEAAKAMGRAIKFKISNAGLIDANSGLASDDYSKLKTQYKLKLSETGVVPLEAILVDKDGNTYNLKTWDTYEKRTETFKKSDDSTEAIFYLPNDRVQTDEYTLYLGWNNDKGMNDGSERQEIAAIEVIAEVTESIPFMTEPASPSSDYKVEYYYTTTRPATPSNP